MVSYPGTSIDPKTFSLSLHALIGSLYVSGKLPTYPSPKPTFFLKWELSVNVGLGEG